MEYQRIVQNTLDLKNDIEFGYAYSRVQARYSDLLGSRAYQKALNRWQAEENARIKREMDAANRTR